MLLESIVEKLEYVKIQGVLKQDVSLVTFDSREVIPNSLFVAISGFQQDGHSYVAKAIESGAKTIVIEKELDIVVDKEITVLKVENARKSLAILGANFYGNPSKEINLIGITGTNGKTSTTYLLKSVFEQVNNSLAVIGTNGTVINNKLYENDNTTPESVKLQAFFKKMVEENVSDCIMEVSSHALELNRVFASSFNIGIFTNLTPDHLELHGDMETYFQAKAKLFELTQKYNIVNIDDPYGRRLVNQLEDTVAETITYGIHNEADVYATDIKYSLSKIEFCLNTPTEKENMVVNLSGEIFLYNALSAATAAYYSGISLKDIKLGFESLKTVDGRFELIYDHHDEKVIIDFAHTEDALKKALTTLRPFVKERLILVFGVYADMSKRGSDKRNGMGKVAAEYADYSIVTSDNPKLNDPDKILEEVSRAVEVNGGKYTAFMDREEAIKHAVSIARAGDVILIAGKGHENVQIIGKNKIPFNEKEIVYKAMSDKWN